MSHFFRVFLWITALFMVTGGAWAQTPEAVADVATGVSETVRTFHAGGFPAPISPQAASITKLYNFMFFIIASIFAVVMVPLLFSLWRYRATAREAAGEKPATFHHNTMVEVVWTAIPVLITIAMAAYSFTTMVQVRVMPEEGLNVEVVAYQFGWDFYYPDFAETNEATGEATHITASEPTAPHAALSAAGTERYVKDLVVPVNVPVKLYVTAQDVIHAFYTPAVGVKIDAVPGRVNMASFTPTQKGSFLGQCTELCGSAHAEMFYNLKVVDWLTFAGYMNNRRAEAGLPALGVEEMQQRVAKKP